jgi:hypothetical protein
MDKDKAAMLIKAIAESIKNDPSQFQFNLNITGMHVAAQGGSTGLIVNATGGGHGSHTIGLNVGLNQTQIEIAKKTADTGISQQMTQLYGALIEIATRLNDEKEKNTIERIYNSLKNTWVPGVITSVLGNILSLSIGIAV